MAATLSAWNDALKRVYTSDSLVEQLYQENPFLDKIQKQTRYAPGETARVVIHTQRAGGFTVLPDGGGTLNTAGNQGIAKAEFDYTHQHMPIAIQGDVIDSASSNAQTVADVEEAHVSGALNDLRKQLTRQLFGNGDALIVVCRTSDSNDVDLNTTAGAQVLKRGWLHVGAQVDVGTTANEVSDVDGDTITAVDRTNVAFTVAGGAETGDSTSDYVSIKNSRSGTTSYEANGLRNIVSASVTLGGLTVAAQDEWAAANVDTTSQALTISLILQQEQEINQRGGNPDFILTSLKQKRKLYEQLQQQVRFDGDKVAAGSNMPKWNGMELHSHPDCWDEDLYVGTFKHLFPIATAKPAWQNSVTGGEILTWAQGTDSYVAKLTYRFNLATDRRNVFARLGGLT